MIDALLTLLGEWSRLAQAKPIRTSLGGMAIALALLVYLGALARARFELRALRVSTGPLFALAGLVVLALSLLVALLDALLAHSDMLLVEERVLLLLAPGEGQGAYESLRRILALAEGGRFVLPGPVHLPLSLLLGVVVYLGLVFWAARTLEELGSLEQKPDDVLARERLEQQKAIAKALAEGRPLPVKPVESVPLADDLTSRWGLRPGKPGSAPKPPLGRIFKLLGHWTSVEYVEARFVRWQGPLVFALAGLAALALPAALAGHFPAPLWVGAAIALDGLRRNLATRTKAPDKPEAEKKEAPPAPRPPLRPLVEAIHAAQGPLLLPPETPGVEPARISPGTALRAKRLLDDLSRELGAEKGLYVHQGLACDAFEARKNVLLCTPPLSGKTTTLDLLLFYALLVEAENVLWLAPSAAAARVAEQRVLARAGALRWKWNIHAANIASGAGSVDNGGFARLAGLRPHTPVDPTHASPSLVFADPEGVHRELCGRQQEWSAFLGGLGLVILPDLEEWHGAPGAHLALLLRRLRRASTRVTSRPTEEGERIRFLCTADPAFRDLGQLGERLVGRPMLVLGPEVDGAPRPPIVSYFLPPRPRTPADVHPAVRALGESLAQGFSAELFGYDDVLSRADVARANEWTLGRDVATRGRAFAGERHELSRALAEAEVVVARVRAASYGKTPILAAHVGFRAATIPEARLAALGAGERVGKAIAPPKPEPKEVLPDQPETTQSPGELQAEAIAQADLERKVLVLWQPDPDPFSALLASERPHFRHPDLELGCALVVDPLAESIQRAHLRAALVEASWSEEELFSDFSRPVVEAELARLESASAEGSRLVRAVQTVLDPETGERRDVPRISAVGEAHPPLCFDVAAEPARLVDRHTNEILFGVERARMLSAAYPGRIFVYRGGRYVVKPASEQDGLASGRVACEREERWLVTSPIREVFVTPVERRNPELRTSNPKRGEGERDERRAEPLRSLGGAPFLFERRLVEVEERSLGLRRHGPDGKPRDLTLYADPLLHRYATKAAVLVFPEASFGPLPEGTLHALVHLFRVTLPAFVWCREEDLLVVRAARFGPSESPAVAFVDAHPGGVGFSESVTLDVLRVACGFSLAIVDRCPAHCAAPEGCPSCLQIPQCHAAPGKETVLDKRGVRELLGKMLGRGSI